MKGDQMKSIAVCRTETSEHKHCIGRIAEQYTICPHRCFAGVLFHKICRASERRNLECVTYLNSRWNVKTKTKILSYLHPRAPPQNAYHTSHAVCYFSNNNDEKIEEKKNHNKSDDRLRAAQHVHLTQPNRSSAFESRYSCTRRRNPNVYCYYSGAAEMESDSAVTLQYPSRHNVWWTKAN